jgi:hypothetical protein
MIWIDGVATDGLEEGEAVSASLATSSGDSATVLIQRSLCRAGSTWRLCRRFLVTLEPGWGTSDLHESLAANDAAFVSAFVFEDVQAGEIEIFNGSADAMRNLLRSHPAIATVDDDLTGDPGQTLPYDNTQYLRTVVPTQNDDPRPPSAALHLAPGDTLTVRYRQPDGTELVANAIVSIP